MKQTSLMVVLKAQSGVPGRLPRQTIHVLHGTKQTRRQQATRRSSPISSARGWRARHHNYSTRPYLRVTRGSAVRV